MSSDEADVQAAQSNYVSLFLARCTALNMYTDAIAVEATRRSILIELRARVLAHANDGRATQRRRPGGPTDCCLSWLVAVREDRIFQATLAFL